MRSSASDATDSVGEDLSVLLSLALEAARLGAQVAADAQAEVRRSGAARATKSSDTDLVTEADRAAERAIRRALHAARPDDGFLGEESVSEWDGHSDSHTDRERVVWVVDPIDGTTNYVYGQPDWAVSVAATRGGQSLAGVVVAPTLGLEYVATLGGGASRNGAPLRLATPPALGKALVATGFGYDPARRGRQGAVVAALLPQVRDIRRRGAAALDFCAVADGSADAYYESGPRWWDFAAGSLIATEAGATVLAQPISVLAQPISVLAQPIPALARPTGGPLAPADVPASPSAVEAASSWFLLAAAAPLFDSLLAELTDLEAPAG